MRLVYPRARTSPEPSSPTLRIGYDIGGTNARICAFDASFGVLATKRARLRDDTSPAGVANIMSALLADLLEELWQGEDVIESVGVGIAAQLQRDGRTVINAPNLGWRDLDFAKVLEDTLPTEAPVLLVNDLNALLWGEYTAGAAKGYSDVLAVYVGTGVGGGLIASNQLIEGGGGKAGEIGHVKVEVEGRRCGCGEHGCLEAYAGGIHLETLTRQALVHEDTPTKLRDRISSGENGEVVDLLASDQLADQWPALEAIWEDASKKLAMSIANACTLLNPSLLLMGGGVWENCGRFRERTLTRLTPLILQAARADLAIAEPQLGDIAGMLGAAALSAKIL